MSVREYVDRFEDLYKYASDIFPTEAQKYYRFKEGLQTVLKISYQYMRAIILGVGLRRQSKKRS